MEKDSDSSSDSDSDNSSSSNPENSDGDSDNSQDDDNSHDGELIPVNKPEERSKLTMEFLDDCELTPEPIPVCYFCCVCGVPAGLNAFACSESDHGLCGECMSEFEFPWCPFVFLEDGKPVFCHSSLHQLDDNESVILELIRASSEVNCIYYSKGCHFTGSWDDEVKIHQQTCQFASLKE